MKSRAGTILIIVAGVCALLAGLTVTFLVRMRADAEEMQVVLRDTQARLMLTSACNWIMEASRIGWTPPSNDLLSNKETFGWIDVRDNKLGPKFHANGIDDASRFPLRTFKRFPMYMMKQPPYAVQLTVSYNPILTTESPVSVPKGDPRYGMPHLRYPDPLPVTNNGYYRSDIKGTSVNDTGFAAWAQGDPTPRAESIDQSWFRIWRESGATFLVTCGAGGTKGFRSWNEMNTNERAEFNDDSGLFAALQANEIRLWYRVEWNAAGPDMNYHILDRSIGDGYDHYMVSPVNGYHSKSGHEQRTMPFSRSMGGCIR